jgi:hypothetical protein
MKTSCPRSIVIEHINMIEMQTILSMIGEQATECSFCLTSHDLSITHMDNLKVTLFEYQIKASNFPSYIFPSTLSSVTFSANINDLSIAIKGIKSNETANLRIDSPCYLIIQSKSCLTQVSISVFTTNKVDQKPKSKQLGLASFWQ